jgi:hypothetical protein
MIDYRLSKNALLASIAASLKAGEGGIPKILSRMMLLNRVGYPHGINTGRGYRGGYDLEQVWQTIFAFQLMKFDVPHSRTIKIANASWSIARSAIAHSLPGSSIPGLTFYWIGEPSRLSEMEGEVRTSSAPENEALHSPVMTWAMQPGQALQDVALREYHLEDGWWINVQQLVDRVLHRLADPALEIDQDELMAGLSSWAGR